MTATADAIQTVSDMSDELVSKGHVPSVAEGLICLMLVGSQARGWANPTSDFDICVVTRAPYKHAEARSVAVPLDPASTRVREFEVLGRRCELAYWTSGQIEQMVSKVSWSAFESEGVSLKSLVEVEETLLERFATAIAFVGEEWLQEQRTAVETSAFRTFISTFSMSSADGKLEDIEGMLEVGDTESAVLAARLALDHMVDAMLDSRGIYGSRIPKWRMRRLREGSNLPLSPERYWSLSTMAGFLDSDPVDWISDVVEVCQAISMEIEL